VDNLLDPSPGRVAGITLEPLGGPVKRHQARHRNNKRRSDMDEQSTRTPDSARQGQEAARRQQAPPPQPAREAARDTTRVAGQLAGLGTETITLWADTAQHALREVAELSAHATQEGTRQLAEWQHTNVQLVREMQNAAFGWATVWPEFLRDPIHGYQRSLEHSIEATGRVLELTRHNAETLTQSFQRLERAAGDAARTLGETFRDASTRMQDVYARTDRLRAA
jgi:hypothetical protein